MKTAAVVSLILWTLLAVAVGAYLKPDEVPHRIVFVGQEGGLENYPERYQPIQFLRYSKKGQLDERDLPRNFFSEPYSPPPKPEPRPEQERQWSLLAVGDIMAHSDLQLGAYLHKDDPDETAGGYGWLFKNVAGLFSTADVVIGNLETAVVPDEPRSGYPRFNVDPQMLDALKHLGFDVLFTANNHALDYGVAGAIKTQEQLDQRGLLHLGTNHPEAEVREFLLLPVGDLDALQVGLVNYTFIINEPLPDDRIMQYIPPDTDHVAEFERAISAARAAGAEYVVVVLHWGWEYHLNPTPLQREVAKALCLQGADMILGSGPHVIQPMERMYSKGGEMLEAHEEGAREHFVAYSMGNLISHQGGMSQYGMALELVLAEEGGVVSVQRAIPHVMKSVVRREELEIDGVVRAHDSYQLEEVPLAEFVDYIR
jgi:poly-gamma-glutamate capsule biosynthesis protein CapA/YwtB (metallophosphatase superfamily)